ncbi:unnamed protein product [Rhizophagus irregularis]|nr:unnamed protein product [Rhizophagus irregularis]
MAENTCSSDITGTADTDSNVDESLKQLLNYSTPKHFPLNLQHQFLAHHYIATENIWANLNLRCIEKFGNQNYIKNNITISNIMWASMTLPAYHGWNTMKDYFYYIDNWNYWMTKINNFCNNNSQTANIANSDSIIGELSYHKTNESVESNSPSQALPAVANKSDKLNVPPVANKNNELNSPPQVLPIANKSTDNESIKLNSSIQAPPVVVPEKVSVDSKITHIEIGRKSI